MRFFLMKRNARCTISTALPALMNRQALPAVRSILMHSTISAICSEAWAAAVSAIFLTIFSAAAVSAAVHQDAIPEDRLKAQVSVTILIYLFMMQCSVQRRKSVLNTMKHAKHVTVQAVQRGQAGKRVLPVRDRVRSAEVRVFLLFSRHVLPVRGQVR